MEKRYQEVKQEVKKAVLKGEEFINSLEHIINSTTKEEDEAFEILAKDDQEMDDLMERLDNISEKLVG